MRHLCGSILDSYRCSSRNFFMQPPCCYIILQKLLIQKVSFIFLKSIPRNHCMALLQVTLVPISQVCLPTVCRKLKGMTYDHTKFNLKPYACFLVESCTQTDNQPYVYSLHHANHIKNTQKINFVSRINIISCITKSLLHM